MSASYIIDIIPHTKDEIQHVSWIDLGTPGLSMQWEYTTNRGKHSHTHVYNIMNTNYSGIYLLSTIYVYILTHLDLMMY